MHGIARSNAGDFTGGLRGRHIGAPDQLTRVSLGTGCSRRAAGSQHRDGDL